MESARHPSQRTALVLSGGGARAAYQVGVIAAIAERYPHLGFPILTGVSAGAINTAFLASHRGELGVAIRDLQQGWSRLTTRRVFRFDAGEAVPAMMRGVAHLLTGKRRGEPAVRGLLDMSPLRAFLAGAIDFDGIADNVRHGRLRAVGLSATSYSTGFTKTFVQGADDLVMWQRAMRIAERSDIGVDHVLASAAIPLVFSAVRLGNQFYGDGSLRQTAPLAPAIHFGAERILTISMRAGHDTTEPEVESVAYPSSAQITGMIFNSIFMGALDADAERLERFNRVLEALPVGQRGVGGLRPIRLLKLRPSRDLGEMARGLQVDFPASVSFMLRGLGGSRTGAGDFLSYLTFEPAYTDQLMDLGYTDGRSRYPEIDGFLAE